MFLCFFSQHKVCISFMHTAVCILRFILCVCVCEQCWCWPDGDFLCVEYSPGEGEGRRHPGCFPDSQKPQTAETPHGADTGEQPFEPEFAITFDYSFVTGPNRHVRKVTHLLSSHLLIQWEWSFFKRCFYPLLPSHGFIYTAVVCHQCEIPYVSAQGITGAYVFSLVDDWPQAKQKPVRFWQRFRFRIYVIKLISTVEPTEVWSQILRACLQGQEVSLI